MVAKSVRATPAAVPRHVAIIMDGNGRWARERALPRISGHKAGIKPVRQAVRYCRRAGVSVLTLFAFSSENWSRPPDEVRGLMRLFREALRREIDELDENGVRLRFIGDRDRLSPALDEAARAAEMRTAGNDAMDLVIAVAYGGRWDIVQSVRAIAERVRAGEVDPADVDEAMVGAGLETAGLPAVDLLIRTGAERRVSNFLLWDIAYSEIFFSDLLWPQFTEAELQRALDFYSQRQRRFGRTAEQVEANNC